MTRNFDATWKGRSEWFRKGDAKTLNLSSPTQVKPDTQYDIRFDSDTTGTWTGTGLGLTDEKVVLPLAKEGFNVAPFVDAWIFPGAGGQSSSRIDCDAPRVAMETNFFQGRSRSMLVTVYTPSEAKDAMLLNSVNAVAFRDQRASTKEGERSSSRAIDTLFSSMQGWKGKQIGEYNPRDPPSKLGAPKDIGTFDPATFLRSEECAMFQDNLVMGIPAKLRPSGGCELYVGCQTTPALFQLITYTFDAAGSFATVRYEEFAPSA